MFLSVRRSVPRLRPFRPARTRLRLEELESRTLLSTAAVLHALPLPEVASSATLSAPGLRLDFTPPGLSRTGDQSATPGNPHNVAVTREIVSTPGQVIIQESLQSTAIVAQVVIEIQLITTRSVDTPVPVAPSAPSPPAASSPHVIEDVPVRESATPPTSAAPTSELSPNFSVNESPVSTPQTAAATPSSSASTANVTAEPAQPVSGSSDTPDVVTTSTTIVVEVGAPTRVPITISAPSIQTASAPSSPVVAESSSLSPAEAASLVPALEATDRAAMAQVAAALAAEANQHSDQAPPTNTATTPRLSAQPVVAPVPEQSPPVQPSTTNPNKTFRIESGGGDNPVDLQQSESQSEAESRGTPSPEPTPERPDANPLDPTDLDACFTDMLESSLGESDTLAERWLERSVLAPQQAVAIGLLAASLQIFREAEEDRRKKRKQRRRER